MISERQEKLLNFLIKEYISTAEPVSSLALKKVTDWDVCGATIRNDLQELTKQGFIEQPHTSAGRVPTKKAYQHFADRIANPRAEEFSDFIVRQIRTAHQQIEREMKIAEELMKSLSEISTTLNYTRIQKSDNLIEILEILGPSKSTHEKNIETMNKIIKELEQW
jgi:heat-inducible transcriptional repressor